MIARKVLEEELKAQHLNWKLNQTSNELNMDLSGIKNKIIKNSKKSGDNLVVKDEDILKYLNEINGKFFKGDFFLLKNILSKAIFYLRNK